MKHILKKALLSTLVLSALASQDAFAQKGKDNKTANNAANHEASVAFGTVFGNLIQTNIESLGLKFDGKQLDQKAFLDALQKSLTGTPAMDNTKAQEYVNSFISTQQDKKANEAAAAGKEFLAQNSTKAGVVTTTSGLQYEIITKGKGEKHPTLSNKVKVHYHGTLPDGKVFDSSVQRGEPISFPLNGVIQGWQEGVQLMTVGDKFRFFIPHELGYGSRPAGQIPAYSTLIFEVELLDIE